MFAIFAFLMNIQIKKITVKMRKMIFLAALMLGLASCTISANENTDDTSQYDNQLVQSGTVAPDFNFVCARYPKGTKLSALKGHYVVLDFWASWCPDCRKDVPTMVELYKKYSEKGVEFLSISFDTDSVKWQKFVADNNMTWMQYSELKKWKKETTIDTLYKVNWIPTTYLIAPDGKIVLGTVDIKKLSNALEEIK